MEPLAYEKKNADVSNLTGKPVASNALKEAEPDLSLFKPGQLNRGRGSPTELAWMFLQALFVSSWLPGSFHRRFLLRAFGASIGKCAIIKPGVKVKFPWRLTLGDYVWVGENVWVDNLDCVSIGDHVCISQGAYLCTGSHDWTKSSFDLIIKPIRIQSGAWIASNASVGPGVEVGEGAVLSLASVATKDLKPWSVNVGNPAVAVKARVVVE